VEDAFGNAFVKQGCCMAEKSARVVGMSLSGMQILFNGSLNSGFVRNISDASFLALTHPLQGGWMVSH
jgi:hypothetical protein